MNAGLQIEIGKQGLMAITTVQGTKILWDMNTTYNSVTIRRITALRLSP